MVTVIVGLPGSGKTTYAAKISKKAQKKGIKVYSNVLIDGNYLIDVSDLGVYDISDGIVIIDEAGIDFNNRSWKNMQKNTLAFAKKHRHYHVDVFVLSQAFDFDIVWRRICSEMYIIKKSIIPGLSMLSSVRQYWDVDQEGQPGVKWKIVPFFVKLFFRPLYYRYFDSFQVDPLERRDFPLGRSSLSSHINKKIIVVDKVCSTISSILTGYYDVCNRMFDNYLPY